MGALLQKDVPLHTHAPLAGLHTQWYKCQGSVAEPEFGFRGCGLTPHAVCVTVSHGKNCSSGPEGDAAEAGCVSSGEA